MNILLAIFLHACFLFMPALAGAMEIELPASLGATAEVRRGERDGLWEKTLLVRFTGERRVLSTSDGMLSARAAINHAAHPLLWHRLGIDSKSYALGVRDALAVQLQQPPTVIAQMSTAADMDHIAVATRSYGPLTVTVLATAGARSNAIRTGVDVGSYIEGLDDEKKPVGTINIMLLTNIELSDAALARALITITEGKTAALEDLKVPSSYTKDVQATGTGTDSIIVVSGGAAPRASYTGGHSRIGELIGKATYAAVVEALGKQNGFYLPGVRRFGDTPVGPVKRVGDLRIALLHLDPIPGDIAGNRARIEEGIREAVRHGADWVVTPELAETGYNFAKRIGSDWVHPFPSNWLSGLAAVARDNGVALFVGIAERDPVTLKLHNSVAVIERTGRVLGTYRKQRPVGGAEAWSVAGHEGRPFVVDGFQVGILICADAWSPDAATHLAARGAQILLSPANWPPVEGMGPGDIWEKRSLDTGLPLVVVNRGGQEHELDFSHSESAVSIDGRRVFTFTAPKGGIFYVDWDRQRHFQSVTSD